MSKFYYFWQWWDDAVEIDTVNNIRWFINLDIQTLISSCDEFYDRYPHYLDRHTNEVMMHFIEKYK